MGSGIKKGVTKIWGGDLTWSCEHTNKVYR